MAPVPAMLATTPNAAVPLAFRKSRNTNGDEKFSGAGIMFVTPAGDALFLKRKGADHAGEWAFPAGRVEQDEEPIDAARREAFEEVGRLPRWALTGLHRETSEDGVDFATFGQLIEARFDPVLNDESEAYVWASLLDPPEPLHPGVARMLKKFFEEEAAEPEHRSGSASNVARALDAASLTKEEAAYTDGPVDKEPCRDCSMFRVARAGQHDDRCTLVKGVIESAGHCKHWDHDSAVVGATDSVPLAMDRDTVRSFDQDGRMRVAVTNISKANICPYRGEEIPEYERLGLEKDKIYLLLRDPEELRKSVPTWNGIQLLRKHEPVDADDHKKHDIIGTTGTNAEYDHPYLRNSLVFWTSEGINLVETQKQRELSCGYHYDPDMTPGVYEGYPYDGVMRNIRGNHVAVVEEGRVGSDVMVADSIAALQWAAIADALAGAWR
jgi:8-oxo-dGTP pyrophosphatase MutT (NUDIX family)